MIEIHKVSTRLSTIHDEEIDEYTTAVLKAIEYSSMQCLPSSAKNRSNKKNDVTPGLSLIHI